MMSLKQIIKTVYPNRIRNMTLVKKEATTMAKKDYRPSNRDRFEDLVALVGIDRQSISNQPFENVIIPDPEDDDPENPSLGRMAKMRST